MEFNTFEEYAAEVARMRNALEEAVARGDFAAADRYKFQLIRLTNVSPEWWERAKSNF